MMVRFVWADLRRNPRRTASAMIGVILGVGLSCAVLFLVDGLSASMTQRAVAPLPIDMQRISNKPIAAELMLTDHVTPSVGTTGESTVRLVVRNADTVRANEVVVRSAPPAGWLYVAGSALTDGKANPVTAHNPFFDPLTHAGLNLGVLEAGSAHELEYRVRRPPDRRGADGPKVRSTVSSREAPEPVPAATPRVVDLDRLVTNIRRLDGVASAQQLSFADLPTGSLSARDRQSREPARIFGFDAGYRTQEPAIRIVSGRQRRGQALLSREAAANLELNIGDTVAVRLPDGSQLNPRVSGIVDLSGARSLFVSRLGAHFEVFDYVAASVVIDPETFSQHVMPAYDRAAAEGGQPIKSPPIREVDIRVERHRLDADPATALTQTRRIAAAVTATAGGQDYLLDNISNTLSVASGDANVAKRLFLLLGAPGAILAAVLAAYAGAVLAAAGQHDRATLRLRGARRGQLRAMLAMRVAFITIVGSLIGLGLGYGSAVLVIGQHALSRAATDRLATSAVLGTMIGLVATSAALYVTGRRSIDRSIDGTGLASPIPLWRRLYLDVAGVAVVAVATVLAVKHDAFAGNPGSVYVARSVKLPLAVIALPLAAWLGGGLLMGRAIAWTMRRHRSGASTGYDKPVKLLYRLSVQRRSWAIAQAAVAVGLVVALGTSVAVFTASYDRAKAADARYVIGSDLRISPTPGQAFQPSERSRLNVAGVAALTPIVYGTKNVIIRSQRTSDPMNLAAADPLSYARVAPLRDNQFSASSAANAIDKLASQQDAVLLNTEQADFLQADIGDTVNILLARGTPRQVGVNLKVVGLFDRLPGFPDGADALMNLSEHKRALPSTRPDLYLAQTTDSTQGTLEQAVKALKAGPGANGALQVESRATALAKDQSSLAALNIRGLLDLDTSYALAMSAVLIAIFVFGLLLQRRREYVTLRAQGLQPGAIRALIAAEAATVAVAGCLSGALIGLTMGAYLVRTLRPLFVLTPTIEVPIGATTTILASVLAATAITSLAASSLVNRLSATELLRDE